MCKDKTLLDHAESAPAKIPRLSAYSTIPFFTPSYGPAQDDIADVSSIPTPSNTPQTTTSDTVRKSVADPLVIATSHPGHRIPLEHLVQTNLSWEKNSVLSANASQSRLVGLSTFPPKIEWTSPSHIIQQAKARKTVEEDLYARFLNFGAFRRCFSMLI